MDQQSFAFARSPAHRFTPTQVLADAIVRGRVSTPVVRPNGTIVVRLQGIDAPELHRQVTLPRATPHLHPFVGPFRQPGGVSAVRQLAHRLRAMGGPRLDCTVITRVDHPGDAFDTYGRCVADVYVRASGRMLHVNDWLLAHGWALPTFYTSMRSDEIRHAMALTRVARRERRGVWAHYTREVAHFDRGRTYGGLDRDQPDAPDLGPVVLPKLFRRQAAWTVSRAAGVFHGGFGAFLAGYGGSGDRFVPTDRFLESGTEASTLAFASEVRRQRLCLPPEALVFREANAGVYDRGGQAIDGW